MQDFKECLDDLEQQVADFTDEVEQLASFTAESISFEVGVGPVFQESQHVATDSSAPPHTSFVLLCMSVVYCTHKQQELIGHCSAVYSVNRATALALEQHLVQYGFQQPPGAVLEPESLQDCMQEDSGGTCGVHSSGCLVNTAELTGNANSYSASFACPWLSAVMPHAVLIAVARPPQNTHKPTPTTRSPAARGLFSVHRLCAPGQLHTSITGKPVSMISKLIMLVSGSSWQSCDDDVRHTQGTTCMQLAA